MPIKQEPVLDLLLIIQEKALRLIVTKRDYQLILKLIC